jgi:hypothetical protein
MAAVRLSIEGLLILSEVALPYGEESEQSSEYVVRMRKPTKAPAAGAGGAAVTVVDSALLYKKRSVHDVSRRIPLHLLESEFTSRPKHDLFVAVLKAHASLGELNFSRLQRQKIMLPPPVIFRLGMIAIESAFIFELISMVMEVCVEPTDSES